jgi:hypothetical protein
VVFLPSQFKQKQPPSQPSLKVIPKSSLNILVGLPFYGRFRLCSETMIGEFSRTQGGTNIPYIIFSKFLCNLLAAVYKNKSL